MLIITLLVLPSLHTYPMQEDMKVITFGGMFSVTWRILDQRFQQSRTIPGTRKLHSFVPVSNSTVEVRSYSASDASRKERVTLAKDDLPPETIAGFVTCLHDGNWWLAYVC